MLVWFFNFYRKVENIQKGKPINTKSKENKSKESKPKEGKSLEVKPASKISDDAMAQMMFNAKQKSTFATYVLWFFLGGVGAHRFFTGNTFSAVVMLMLGVFGIFLALVFLPVGMFLFIVLGIWYVVDIFLIPGLVVKCNEKIVLEVSNK